MASSARNEMAPMRRLRHARRGPAPRALGGEAQREIFQRLVGDPAVVVAPDGQDALASGHVFPRAAHAGYGPGRGWVGKGVLPLPCGEGPGSAPCVPPISAAPLGEAQRDIFQHLVRAPAMGVAPDGQDALAFGRCSPVRTMQIRGRCDGGIGNGRVDRGQGRSLPLGELRNVLFRTAPRLWRSNLANAQIWHLLPLA